jgi:hypothetical protein
LQGRQGLVTQRPVVAARNARTLFVTAPARAAKRSNSKHASTRFEQQFGWRSAKAERRIEMLGVHESNNEPDRQKEAPSATQAVKDCDQFNIRRGVI